MSAEKLKHRALASSVAALLTAVALPANAQTAQGAQAPENYVVDGNNVDIIRGTFNHSATDVAIGPSSGGLSYSRIIAGDVQRSNVDGLIEVLAVGEISPGSYLWQYTVSIGGQSDVFLIHASTPQPVESREADGSTITFDGLQTYTYVDRSGVVRRFGANLANPGSGTGTPPMGPGGRIVELVKPNGERWEWHYRSATLTGHPPVHRIQSVTSSLGYQLKFEYGFNGIPASTAEMVAFGTLSKAVGINNVVDWCDPTADTCSSLTRSWPNSSYATTMFTGGYRLDVTDALAQTTGYVFDSSGGSDSLLTEIDWPEPTRASTTLTYSGLKVASYSDGRGTWHYAFTPSGISFQNTAVTDPNGQQSNYRARLRFGPPPSPSGDYTEMQRLNWFQDPTGARTYTNYDGNGRLIGVTYPEGNKIEYDRDARGNITQVRQIAKPTAPAPHIVASWVYPTTCTSTTRATCNQPTSATDARGATTDYTYDATHGGLLTATRPAATPGQDRPQTRYAYQSLQAWRRTSPSTTQVAAPAVTMPVQVSSCAAGTASTCVGTAQEVRTTTSYQVGNATQGSNLLPVSITSGAGDGSLLATTSTTWNADGDQLTVDGPLPGTTDTTWYAYDSLRRQVGVIGPDPDGAGPLPFPASRTRFNADGQVTEVEQGSATGQSDAAFAAMTVLSEIVTTYDAQGRKAKDVQVVGTGTVGVTQNAYDDEGRLLCTAVRMNPASYSTPPASACTLPASPGAFGEDRITRNAYDAADRLVTLTSAFGTSDEQVSRRQNWTPNGKVNWVEDANGNRSTYVYDGFDRIGQLQFPAAAVGAHASNPSDFEQYEYDAAGNVTSRRLRDGQTITYAYDALNRETTKTVPGLGTADDVFTTYDLVDRRLTATFIAPGSTANGIAWTWDALGRPTTETAYGRTLTSTFDLAGRRTKLTWPPPFTGYVEFGWDLAGRMTTATEGPSVGATATYAYDALGRRTSLTRTGAATTTWSYTANSRNWSMTHDLAGGTTNDVTYAFVFNPAGQAISRDISNPAYQFAMPTQAATPYVRDGLNQYDSVNGGTFAHDLRGNLTSDGVRTYNYDAENRLVSVFQGGMLQVDVAYDPLGRIKRTSTISVTEQYLWDGDRLVGTFDGASVPTGRWLHGPGPDEPLAHLLGSQTWLLADHQGSITAEIDAGGAPVGTPYTYDPHGRPDAAHGFAGPRFRYTGQTAFVPTVPLWHYRARAYDPATGRFLQTDPIGYEDSFNLYQYVGNDPFNATDPTGMVAQDPLKDILKAAILRPLRDAVRRAAVRQAWAMERRLFRETGRGTRDWSPAEGRELLQSGSVRGYVGHHRRRVADDPESVGDPDNIEFMTEQAHRDVHAGRRPNSTSPIDRTAGGRLPRPSPGPSQRLWMQALSGTYTAVQVAALFDPIAALTDPNYGRIESLSEAMDDDPESCHPSVYYC